MKRHIITIALLMTFMSAYCGINFSFRAHNVGNTTLLTQMERNISDLLNEMHDASVKGVDLNLSKINMEPEAKTRLTNLWKKCTCDFVDMDIVTNCIQDVQGYQVRDLKIIVKSAEDADNDTTASKLSINLNKSGVITGVNLALEINKEQMSNMYDYYIGASAIRYEILKWLEEYRECYIAKDISQLEKYYSKDSLIMTPKRGIKKQDTKNDSQISGKSNYTLGDNEAYIKKLTELFKKERKIEVTLDSIVIESHKIQSGYYGITFKQSLKTSNYSDEGWHFWVLDNNDAFSPKIIIHTIQTDEDVAKDGIFTLYDFFLP